MATASDPSDKQQQQRADAGGTVSGLLGGLRFNQTGREETAREVLKPQRDPGAARRTAGIVAAVVLGLIVIGALSFARSGLRLSDITRDEHGEGFGSGRPVQSLEQSDSGDTGAAPR